MVRFTDDVISQFPSMDLEMGGPWKEIKLGCAKFPWLNDIISHFFQLQVGSGEEILFRHDRWLN